VYVALRHDFAHESGKRAARPEFNHFRDTGGSASLHAGSPIDGLPDLSRELVRTLGHIEDRGSIDPT
jgi:hypothetical protein